LITGQTDPKVRKEVAEAGADAFFIKPVPMADFLDAVERHLGLVETILPPEPISPIEDKEIQRTLPDLLAGLRQELEAIVVLLLDEDGTVLARAGDLPEKNIEVSLFSSLLSVHSAGQKISRLVGQKTPANWYVFTGAKYDLVFSPIGTTHAVLMLGVNLAAEDRIMKTVSIFSSARPAIEQVIGEAPPPPGTPATQEPMTTPLEIIEQSTKELEPLFKEAKKKFKAHEVNDFWNKAADKHKAPSKPDMLSYEQAKQLGLAPEDEA
jgi:hypothetical protein